MEEQEQEVFDRFRNGDETAFEQLYRRYFMPRGEADLGSLVLYCLRIFNSDPKKEIDCEDADGAGITWSDQDMHQWAEDAAQEAFEKAWKARETFDSGKGKFSTWLYKIAKRTCKDMKKRASYGDPSSRLSDQKQSEQFLPIRHEKNTWKTPGFIENSGSYLDNWYDQRETYVKILEDLLKNPQRKFRGLSERQIKILLAVAKGQDRETVAKEFKLSRNALDQLISRMRKNVCQVSKDGSYKSMTGREYHPEEIRILILKAQHRYEDGVGDLAPEYKFKSGTPIRGNPPTLRISGGERGHYLELTKTGQDLPSPFTREREDWADLLDVHSVSGSKVKELEQTDPKRAERLVGYVFPERVGGAKPAGRYAKKQKEELDADLEDLAKRYRDHDETL